MSNQEREGSIRTPIFDRSNFVYWKVRTTTYLQSLGTNVWEIVEGGYKFPSTIPTDVAGKKKYEDNAKAVTTLLGSLSQSKFFKVMQLKSTKEIWEKIVLRYEGDSQVKHTKLQTLRIQYETLKMHNDEICAIEEKQDLQTITMTQLHRILTTFEIRKGGPSDMREATFKASRKEELNESEGEEEANLVKDLQRGSGRFRGKLSFKCFSCGRVGHHAAKCPHKDMVDKGK
eukprot:PITA_02568